MVKTSDFKIRDVIKNIGAKSIIASLLVFLLTVAATCVGGYHLYTSTKESISCRVE